MSASAKPLPFTHPVDAIGADATSSMQAFVQSGYGGVEVFALGSVPRPTPGEGEVLVRVAAAGLDRGTWHLMTGRPYLMRLMGFGFRRPKQPIPGLDLAGVVCAVGPGVRRLRVGDVVFGIGKGSFAEFAVAREDKLAIKPACLTDAQAAVLGVSGMTAIQAVDAARVERDERVLILGASGGVGSYAVQITKARGAHVTATCSGPKTEFVRSLGADRVLDHARDDFAERSGAFDVILDIGGNPALSRLRRAMAPNGRLVFIGGEHGGDITAGFGRQLLAMAISPFVAQRFEMLMARECSEDLERLADLAHAGTITSALDSVRPLDAMPDAMRDLEAGRVRGKIAFTVA